MRLFRNTFRYYFTNLRTRGHSERERTVVSWTKTATNEQKPTATRTEKRKELTTAIVTRKEQQLGNSQEEQTAMNRSWPPASRCSQLLGVGTMK